MAAEEANALSKAWEEVMITAVSRQGCGGLGRGGGAVCLSVRLSVVSGSRRSYSAGLASAPSALPSTSSSEQSPVPFRTSRRVTTNGRSPRL